MDGSLQVSDDDDAVANLLERRWFAASTAAQAMRDECDILYEVMELAQAGWRNARQQLAELEALRDALAERLIGYETLRPAPVPDWAA